MFTKGKDLEKRFPQMAAFVAEVVKRSTGDVFGFNFLRKPNISGGNFFRWQGELNAKQIRLLARLHRVPRKKFGMGLVHPNQNGIWTEYSTPLDLDMFSLSNHLVFRQGAGLREALWHLTKSEDIKRSVFVNGREVNDAAETKSLRVGDVVVVLSDNNEDMRGSFSEFVEMPTLNVFQETLSGPFFHPDMSGNLPAYIGKNQIFKKLMKLGKFDFVVCQCGVENCRTHNITNKNGVYVRRNIDYNKPVYTIQSPLFLGGNATDQLVPFGSVVLGRRLTSDSQWPDEIIRFEIDGQDVARSTCGVDIEPEMSIEVLLADPRVIK